MERNFNGFKSDLHCHLDGSLPIDTIFRLVRENKDVLPEEYRGLVTDSDAEDKIRRLIVAPKECESLSEYLRCFDFSLKLLQTPDCMEIAGYGLVSSLREQGIKYAEVRFAPQFHSTGVSEDSKFEYEKEIIKGLIRGVKGATMNSDIGVNLILCMMRGDASDKNCVSSNVRTLFLAKEFLGKGVVALDLAGDESSYATADFEDLFLKAREFNIPFTIHAGESGNAKWREDSIERAIYFGAGRIGHGVGLENSPEIRKLAREKGITIECCPSSNVHTKSVVGGIESHPIKLFLEEGLKVTVNTDNMTVSDTTIDKEYALLKGIGVTDDDIFSMQLNAIDGAFVSNEVKDRMKIFLEKNCK